MKKVMQWIVWPVIALLGGLAYAVLAIKRAEPVNSGLVLVAALCTYAIGYRFYSKWIAARVLMLEDRRATPCEVHDDGKDFVKTNPWIVFGHHFAAISGPGPLVGPVLAAQFGYLPGVLWLLIGVVLGGAVQDFVILFCSMRRNGKSLGEMVKSELNSAAGFIALVAILAIMIILLAVLGLVVVKALAESPWGIFTVGATIPIAMFMGGYLRYWRVGKVLEASVIGVVGLLLAVWGGQYVYTDPGWSKIFTVSAEPLAWAIIAYGLAASILPVWLLLAPRDYLSTFMKLGTIFALAVGILCVLPALQMPAFSRYIDGSGPVVAGKLFPFCFITIACGAISGFHALISSGTTPKLITRERYARSIGYGAMLFESLVAVMALIAACALEPGIYLSINIKGAPDATVAKVVADGFMVTVDQMDQLAKMVGEHSLFGRTGGAATLAVGMANIFSKFVGGRGLDLWYHFAIMFEALFILTTLDAGTRVGRYLLQDFLGHVWKPLGETKRLSGNLVASALMVSGWGFFLIQGVRDPLGGVNSLWPLFGIANQLLSCIALCLAVTVILKLQLIAPDPNAASPRPARPVFALLAVVPLVWLLAVTLSAGREKIWSPDPRIGFLAQANALDEKLPALDAALKAAETQAVASKEKVASETPAQPTTLTQPAADQQAAMAAAAKARKDNRTLHFNNMLDAVVAGIFMVLVVLIVGISLAEWICLTARWKLAELRESAPVWLPDYVVAQEQKPVGFLGMLALAVALARELSGEAEMDRARLAAQAIEAQEHSLATANPDGHTCNCAHESASAVKGNLYVWSAERRFNGIKRCC